MRQTRGEKVFNVINVALMAAVIICVAVPLLNVVAISLISAKDLDMSKFVMFPSHFDFKAYVIIFSNGSTILDGYKITLFRVVVGTAFSLMVTYFLSYGLAIRDLPGRSAISVFVFITMLFSGGLIPSYILTRYLGLMNNLLVYILPMAVNAFNALLIRNFIMNVPEALKESAEIDGAKELTVIWRIILPLSLPALATVGLFYAVGQWNSWMDAYLYVGNTKLQPVQLILRNILAVSQISLTKLNGSIRNMSVRPPSRAIQNATIVVSTLPIVFVYPFVQKYFVKGILIGAVKG